MLFTYIPSNDNKVYFLDISIDHNDSVVFANQNLISIINNNWPEILANYHINCISAENPALTDQQRLNLRQKGLNAMDQVENKPLFNLGGGITCAGTSINCQISANLTIKRLSEYEKYCKKSQQDFIPKQIPEFIDFKLYLSDDNLVIRQYPNINIQHIIPLNFMF